MAEILRRANERAGNVRLAKIATDIQDYHASPVDAARAARDARVRSLVLTHIAPPLPSRVQHPLFLQGTSEIYDGPITIARDGMLISLPAGTDTIDTSNAFRI
jgi:ribonuclease Z